MWTPNKHTFSFLSSFLFLMHGVYKGVWKKGCLCIIFLFILKLVGFHVDRRSNTFLCNLFFHMPRTNSMGYEIMMIIMVRLLFSSNASSFFISPFVSYLYNLDFSFSSFNHPLLFYFPFHELSYVPNFYLYTYLYYILPIHC